MHEHGRPGCVQQHLWQPAILDVTLRHFFKPPCSAPKISHDSVSTSPPVIPPPKRDGRALNWHGTGKLDLLGPIFIPGQLFQALLPRLLRAFLSTKHRVVEGGQAVV